MFNKNKNKTPKKVNSNAQKSPSLNMISEGTMLQGNLKSKNDIRIAGKLNGEIHCESKLIVTSSARIEGDLHSVDADIAGHVEGTIKVSNKLVLRESANIGGDVYTKTLIVEEGAHINGACKMGGDALEKESPVKAQSAEKTEAA